VHDALAELLGLLVEGVVDLGDSDRPSAPASWVPRIGDRYVAKERVQLTATVVAANGQLSGRFNLVLLSGDVVRVQAVSSRGPRALLLLEEPGSSTEGNEESTLSAQHSLLVTFTVLQRQFDLLSRAI
jgi:hypothetical protein